MRLLDSLDVNHVGAEPALSLSKGAPTCPAPSAARPLQKSAGNQASARFALGMYSQQKIEISEPTIMPRKPKKKIFSAAKVVREMARERVGSPKPSQLVLAKKTKPERHKPTLGKLLQDE